MRTRRAWVQYRGGGLGFGTPEPPSGSRTISGTLAVTQQASPSPPKNLAAKEYAITNLMYPTPPHPLTPSPPPTF